MSPRRLFPPGGRDLYRQIALLTGMEEDQEVLVVPVSALTLAADGSSRVQRSVDGQLEQVTVEPGLSAQGLVAVDVVDGELNPGDLVVIGFESS